MNTSAAISRYEEYKESGVDWLGSVPSHWKTVPIRAIFRFRNEKNDPIKTEDVLSLSIANGVTRYSDEGRGGNKRKDDLTAYKIARPNDIVMNSMNVIVGAVGVSKYFGAISPVYYALYTHTDDASVSFYERIFQDTGFQRGLLKLGKGILIKISDSGKMNTIRMKISQDDLKTLLFPLPPIEEQLAISNFLDQKTAQIDEAIVIKEKQIALLKERKQIIIQKAVTQGLDPNKPMKDSGLDWIGQIPAHWEVNRLKFLLSDPLKYGANESGVDYDASLPRYVRITDFSGEGKLSDENRLSLPWSVGKDYLLKDGDILLARSGATVGKSYQFKASMSEDKNYCFAGYLIRARCDEEKMLSDYLNLYLNSDCFLSWRNLIFNKATIENIGADKYSTLSVIVPPVDEQGTILSYLKNKLEPIGEGVSHTSKQIEILKEYKTTLINSAVTGKIKVA